MSDRSDPAAIASVVDTMILVMFVDAGRADLLAALAPGGLFVTPSIIDPAESPPFVNQPTAEFARGAFSLQAILGEGSRVSGAVSTGLRVEIECD